MHWVEVPWYQVWLYGILGILCYKFVDRVHDRYFVNKYRFKCKICGLSVKSTSMEAIVQVMAKHKHEEIRA